MSDHPEHPIHRLHHAIRRLEEIGSLIRRAWEIEDFTAMDFTSFETAVSDLKAKVADVETNEAAAVAAAVKVQADADQAELEAKVASDLTRANIGFPPPPAAAEPEAEAEPVAEAEPEPVAEADPNAPAPEGDPAPESTS